mgnify:CR=1 FL=1
MLDVVFAELAARGMPTNLVCDHVCYRVATQQRYEELRTALQAEGVLESDTIIAGRPISTFRLFTPYTYKGRSIEALELPAPKPGTAYPEGWEHAEFVVPGTLQNFMSQHPAQAFDVRALNKPLNPEIGLRLTPAYQAKFHTKTLLDVIKLEKALGI